MTQITINPKHIAAAAKYMAVKDVRYYLNGVLLDPRGFVVATDGHAMLVIKGAFAADVLQDQFIIPADVCKEIAKCKLESIELTIEGGKACVSDAARIAPFAKIDGVFPDWARLYPTSVSGEVAQLDADLVARATAARKALGSGNKSGWFATHYNGPAPAVHILDENVHAITMPLPLRTDPDPFVSLL